MIPARVFRLVVDRGGAFSIWNSKSRCRMAPRWLFREALAEAGLIDKLFEPQ